VCCLTVGFSIPHMCLVLPISPIHDRKVVGTLELADTNEVLMLPEND